MKQDKTLFFFLLLLSRSNTAHRVSNVISKVITRLLGFVWLLFLHRAALTETFSDVMSSRALTS
jgi:hypothetical protein